MYSKSVAEFTWSVKPFSELSLMELHDLLKVRVDVFVVEQECPYEEIDGKDPECLHVIGKSEDGQVIATARIAGPGIVYPEISIGRVAVHPSHRNMRLGQKTMNVAIAYIQAKTENATVKIAAQEYLEKFYGSFGFEKISDSYLWDGIPHIDMRLTF
jgi:ElaA protein